MLQECDESALDDVTLLTALQQRINAREKRIITLQATQGELNEKFESVVKENDEYNSTLNLKNSQLQSCMSENQDTRMAVLGLERDLADSKMEILSLQELRWNYSELNKNMTKCETSFTEVKKVLSLLSPQNSLRLNDVPVKSPRRDKLTADSYIETLEKNIRDVISYMQAQSNTISALEQQLQDAQAEQRRMEIALKDLTSDCDDKYTVCANSVAAWKLRYDEMMKKRKTVVQPPLQDDCFRSK